MNEHTTSSLCHALAEAIRTLSTADLLKYHAALKALSASSDGRPSAALLLKQSGRFIGMLSAVVDDGRSIENQTSTQHG